MDMSRFLGFGTGKMFRKEPEKPNIEELLNKLPPEEREAVQIGAVREGISENPDYAAKASVFYSDKGSGYDERAKFEILKGNPEGAIAIYTTDYPFIEEAAKVARNHISIDRAIQVYEDAIKKENKGWYHEGLAKLYREKGDENKAKEHLKTAIARYEEEGHFDKVEAFERESGNLENVIVMYLRLAEKSKNSGNESAYYYDAIGVAEEIGNQEKVKELNEKFLDALLEQEFFMMLRSESLITLAQKVGNKNKLISAYEKVGQFQNAFELAVREKDSHNMIRIGSLYHGSPEELSKMAKFALDNNQPSIAIMIYERAGRKKDAAKTACQHDFPKKAFDICQPIIDEQIENGYFRDPDYFEIAMDACSALYDDGLLKMAIGRKAIQRFSALGKFEISAKFADKLGESEKANTYRKLALLQKKN